MANKLLQALDNLANVAGQELINSRDFRFKQQERLEAIARLKEEQDRNFELKQSQLDISRQNLALAQRAQGFRESETLAAKDSEIGKLKADADFMKQQMDMLKAEQRLNGARFDALVNAEEGLHKTVTEGLGEAAENIAKLKVRRAEKDFYGTVFTPTDLDFPDFPAGGQPSGETQTAQDNFSLKLLDRAEKMSADFETSFTQLNSMDSLVSRLENNPKLNRIAVDVGVIFAWNKILDPDSVVREGEFDRTEENMAILGRAKGAIEKLSRSGTKLSLADLQEIRGAAQGMMEIRRQILNKKLQQKIHPLAKKRGIDPNEVAPLFEPIQAGGFQNFQQINGGLQGADSTQISDQNLDDFLNQQGL